MDNSFEMSVNTNAEQRNLAAEIKLREERIAALEAELEATNKELEAFSYSVSHDLRAPLRHISNFVDLILSNENSSVSEKDRNFLKIASESAKRMNHLIDDILEYSRTNKIEFNKKELNLRQLTKETIDELHSEIEDRKVVFETDELPRIWADQASVKLMLTNLLSNALKFTKNKKEAIIHIGCQSNDENQSTFFVRDNGVGFDMKYAGKLFGMFQRLHPMDEFEGSGIGLANVRRIVHRHGGKCWSKAEVDKGATFYVSLPKPIE